MTGAHASDLFKRIYLYVSMWLRENDVHRVLGHHLRAQRAEVDAGVLFPDVGDLQGEVRQETGSLAVEMDGLEGRRVREETLPQAE